ncbi:MAG: hypothetical protein WC544_01600 [Patescibacteria group bacterium]
MQSVHSFVKFVNGFASPKVALGQLMRQTKHCPRMTKKLAEFIVQQMGW